MPASLDIGKKEYMTGKKFLNSIANGKSDVAKLFLDQLAELKIDYCVIGELMLTQIQLQALTWI